MTIKLGVVMDPIATIHYKKDSTLALLWEAEARGFEIHYFEQNDLFIRDGEAYGSSRRLKVFRDEKKWFEFGEKKMIALTELDLMLMRKDPPFNLEYIYTSYILELAERSGLRVINKPQSLRDFNEKVFTSLFPECTPKTLITSNKTLLADFFREEKNIVCKPLEGMGGTSVFHLKDEDPNFSVVCEMLTANETRYIMAQRYIPEITEGDKRIILIHGKPIPYALARIPAKGEFRGNLVRGAKGVAKPLTKSDSRICEIVGPYLQEKGLVFVGIDVIGDYLTEINITSPTGIRELDEQCHINIAKNFWDPVI
jgi:glutathione synthase